MTVAKISNLVQFRGTKLNFEKTVLDLGLIILPELRFISCFFYNFNKKIFFFLFFFSAHNAFKECLMEETKSCTSYCQNDDSCHNPSTQASRFARVIVENAIGFLLNRCSK